MHMDTVDWTTLMSCYVRNGLPDKALFLFRVMQEENIDIDEVTFVSVFAACSKVGDVKCGMHGYGWMIKRGLPFIVSVSNAVMDMYVKCGRMKDGRRVFDEMSEKSVVSWSVMLNGVIKFEGVEKGRCWFDEMPERNEVSWTLMIAGYIENGFSREAFSLVSDMMSGMCFELNHVTLCSFLGACSLSGNLLMGKWVHVYAMKTMEKDMHLMVGTALVDMYSKCGQIDIACKVFETMAYRNVVAWNALLIGLALHGRGTSALELFSRMVREVKPDDVTFVAVLSACNHSGLVDQGFQYFYDLGTRYGLMPKIEHYACMVDLLGRAGRIEEAEFLVKGMPIPPNEVILGSLLAACGLHGKLHLGKHLLQELIQIAPLNTEYHVLLSNMHTLAGRKDEADSLRQILKNRRITKVPGMSSIQVDGLVHHFSSGDKSHPQTQDVYLMLDEMSQKLRLVGYIPNNSSEVLSVSESELDNVNLKEKERAMVQRLGIALSFCEVHSGSYVSSDCNVKFKFLELLRSKQLSGMFSVFVLMSYDWGVHPISNAQTKNASQPAVVDDAASKSTT
ncbi:hypothetical protein IFM89_033864, partial [Coptis chinensis]